MQMQPIWPKRWKVLNPSRYLCVYKELLQTTPEQFRFCFARDRSSAQTQRSFHPKANLTCQKKTRSQSFLCISTSGNYCNNPLRLGTTSQAGGPGQGTPSNHQVWWFECEWGGRGWRGERLVWFTLKLRRRNEKLLFTFYVQCSPCFHPHPGKTQVIE